MRITEQQLRNLVRKLLLTEVRDGYMVPRFETTEDMMLFLDELGPDDTTMQDVFDPQTGEVWLEAGMTPLEMGLIEAEPEEKEKSDPDRLDHYDWDAYEKERAAEIERKEQEYEAALTQSRQAAEEAGSDWAMDAMHDAQSNYEQEGYSSPADMVMARGQDVSADVVLDVEYWLPAESEKVYKTLPSGDPLTYAATPFIPTKQTFKEILADYFYGGVEQGVQAAEDRYAG